MGDLFAGFVAPGGGAVGTGAGCVDAKQGQTGGLSAGGFGEWEVGDEDYVGDDGVGVGGPWFEPACHKGMCQIAAAVFSQNTC